MFLWVKWRKVMAILLKNPSCPLLSGKNFPGDKYAHFHSPTSLQKCFRVVSTFSSLKPPKGEMQPGTDGTDVRKTRSSCFFPARDLGLSEWSPPRLPNVPPPLLLLQPGQLAETLTPLSRAGKVGLCSAGLPFKGLFGHNHPYYSCRLRCQSEELMFHSAKQEIGSFFLYV